ncbi:MAG: DUF58 domain-containing protein [Alphaproteobacteria bacterium]
MASDIANRTLRALDESASLGSRLPALLVEADRVAQSVAQGVHGRRRVGIGETFWQFRPYQFGDPVSAIDWRQTARGERAYIRENEWEAAQSIWLWRDAGSSMRWRSGKDLPSKRWRSELLLLALGNLLMRGGEHIALLGTEQPPSSGKATAERMARTLVDMNMPGHNLDLPQAEQTRPIPRFARMVLISDFFDEIEPLEELVRRQAGRNIRGHLVQVLDPAEIELPYFGRVQFEAMEEGGGAELIPKVQLIRRSYVKRLKARQDALNDLARRTGWEMTVHRTDQPPQTALLALFQSMTAAKGVG